MEVLEIATMGGKQPAATFGGNFQMFMFKCLSKTAVGSGCVRSNTKAKKVQKCSKSLSNLTHLMLRAKYHSQRINQVKKVC